MRKGMEGRVRCISAKASNLAWLERNAYIRMGLEGTETTEMGWGSFEEDADSLSLDLIL